VPTTHQSTHGNNVVALETAVSITGTTNLSGQIDDWWVVGTQYPIILIFTCNQNLQAPPTPPYAMWTLDLDEKPTLMSLPLPPQGCAQKRFYLFGNSLL